MKIELLHEAYTAPYVTSIKEAASIATSFVEADNSIREIINNLNMKYFGDHCVSSFPSEQQIRVSDSINGDDYLVINLNAEP